MTSSVARRLLQACRPRPLRRTRATTSRPLRQAYGPRPLRRTRATACLAAAGAIAAFGLVGIPGIAASAAAAPSPAASLSPAPAPVSAAGVQGLTASPADRVALTETYASARHVPGSAVAGIRPGSLHLARVTATGVTWAVAGFTPSPAAGLKAQIGSRTARPAGCSAGRPGSRGASFSPQRQRERVTRHCRRRSARPGIWPNRPAAARRWQPRRALRPGPGRQRAARAP